MSGLTPSIVRWVLLAAASAGYLLLAHWTTSTEQPSMLGAAVAIAPLIAISLAVAWRAKHRTFAMASWLLVVAVLAYRWPSLETGFVWVYFIQHFGAFALLTIVFGRTLLGDEDPMITRFARIAHGARLAPAVAAYTRRVTVLWTGFFALMAAGSAALFSFDSQAHWSFFANILSPALIVAVFAGEFIVRLRALPSELRTGLMDSIRASVQAARQASSPPAL